MGGLEKEMKIGDHARARRGDYSVVGALFGGGDAKIAVACGLKRWPGGVDQHRADVVVVRKS